MCAGQDAENSIGKITKAHYYCPLNPNLSIYGEAERVTNQGCSPVEPRMGAEYRRLAAPWICGISR